MPNISRSPKIFRSEHQWREILDRFASSGLTQEQFCTREGLALSTFYSWRAKLQLSTESAVPHVADFVEVTPTCSSSSFDIELALPGGVVLRMRTR